MERADALVIEVDEAEIVELLQQEMARIVEDLAARVIADALQEHLEARAVVQVLARMDLEAQIDAGGIERVEDRASSAAASSSNAVSIRPAGRCGQG